MNSQNENQIQEGDGLVLMRSIKSQSVDLILCDLPYGTTTYKWDKRISFQKLWKQYKRIITPRGVIALFAIQPFTSMLIMSNLKMFKYCWIWEKPNPGNIFNCKNSPMKNYTDIVIFSSGVIANNGKNMMVYFPQGIQKIMEKRKNNRRKKDDYSGIRPSRKAGTLYVQEYTNYPTQILKFKSDKKAHDTQKPVTLCEYLIKTYSREGDLILDNCAGSGTTAIACLNTNRKFIMMEKSSDFVNIIKDRIKNEFPLRKFFI